MRGATWCLSTTLTSPCSRKKIFCCFEFFLKLFKQLFERFFVKKISKNSWEAYINFGRDKTNIDVIEWIKEMSSLNFGEILLTSIDADGVSNGFDVELYENVCKHINIPIIAGGGFGKLNHISELKKYAKIDAISSWDQ